MMGVVANLEMNGHNPLLPMTYNLVWSGLLLISLIVTVVLVVDIIRLPATVAETVVLILLVLLAPVVGWAIYLVLRPRITVRRKG
ncbi:hypothetical protein H7347_09665 [Corynebacterium sp. zg-331]|uniref:hypothetical protein n=1 Tax=unclassified Corynebacterium TaxID=2624378 RepID=UPI00128B928F|nr:MULTISPECIES: hypothetical protein [unclassified Corynebacterium]MBC3186827.1 hypothetical protein [Corynebacterium sp. zg-331]MPV53307.1 hypothetical protein [Corynebacterium sp. zg331]